MIRPADRVTVYLCQTHVDMRKSIDGLAALVEQQLCLDPFSEQLFVFCNKKRDKVKILFWERNGFVLWYKRLEKERFQWPKSSGPDAHILSGQQLNLLLDGYNIWQGPHQRLRYSAVV